MRFKEPLIKATLIRRYKRFLVDVKLKDGSLLTAHTANTGRMMGCSEPNSCVWLSDSKNIKRKYRHSLEITKTINEVNVGVNTSLANLLAKEAIENGCAGQLQGYDNIRTEVVYGNENSRIDLLLEKGDSNSKCYIEVKNVTAVSGNTAIFPDAVTARGVKHLRELTAIVNQNRCVMFFCVQRNDAVAMRPADEIDPVYGQAMRKAADAGVEMIAYKAKVTPTEIILQTQIPVILP